MALLRLQLRAQLYEQAERPEERAAQILEQARSADKAGSVRMRRALLIQAGQALSPDAFGHVLDAESETKEATGKGPVTVVQKLGNKARQFAAAVAKAPGHLKRIGSENARER